MTDEMRADGESNVFSRICLLAGLLTGALLTHPAMADTSKASSWVGRVVVTQDGELLGRIEDLAVDLANKRIDYVVVSIGSFLIDDNLIAVHPDALGESEDGRYLVIYTDGLDAARRFGTGNWPAQADVLASADRAPVTVEQIETEDDTGFDAGRVATISDGRRTATVKPGERTQIEVAPDAETPATSAPEVRPKRFRQDSGPEPLLADSEFERLDDNGDGYLSRSEIGARLARDVRYTDYDLDGNDGIDPFEFQIMKERG